MKAIATFLLILCTLQASAQSMKQLYNGQDKQGHSIAEIAPHSLNTCCGYDIPTGPAAIKANGRGAGAVYIVDGIALIQPNTVNPLNVVPGRYILKRDEILHMPTSQINDLVSIFPGIYQVRRGDGVSIYAGRISSVSYVIDGIMQ